MSDKLERKDIDQPKIDWNEHAEYWDDFEEAKHYTKHIVRLLTARIDVENRTILDFGCGTGLLIDYMTKKAKQIVAVDTSDKMISVLESKNYNNVETINDELSKESIIRYPALQNKFDLIVAVSVCAFLPNYLEVLTTIKSLLKPDGIFIQWDWLRTEKDPDFGFTEEMIKDNYDRVGLKVESVDIPFHMTENDEKMEVIMAIGKL
ncbi:class I SAM-dependent methyltransferase [Fulvivirgaceae bacterium BMA10]|uniref:Class I SAM-dependent methyltransferase n=1 Tax=Splendidivirga corallicola TaxID=3051826 RepID=A0ABT8KNA9_9BACT|nr:class I SAM-dependent methyltransferase [Fulvivirgaceae bacterium BMA10]